MFSLIFCFSFSSCTRFRATFPLISDTLAHVPINSSSALPVFLLRTASALAFAKRHCRSLQCASLTWWPASPPLLRDDDGTGEDSRVAVAAAAMDASSAACFRRWKIWPHPRLIRLFFPLLSGTVASVVVVVACLSGDPLRRPGESAHCVLLDPSKRTAEPVRGSNGDRGLDAVLGVVVEPLEASLHSDPELATSAAASRETAMLPSLRRSDGATRPGVSVTPAGLVDGRKRMERPNACPAPFPDACFPIFLASASASAKRGTSVQLRCRERERGESSLTRWSARVTTDGDGGGGGAEDKGDGGRGALLLPLLLPVDEEGQSVRAIETATGDVVAPGSARETERRALWRTGESAEAGSGDRPGSSAVPEADVHRFDDDMMAPARWSGQLELGTPGVLWISNDIYDALALDVGIGTLAVWRSNGRPAASDPERGRPASERRTSQLRVPPCRTADDAVAP